MNTSPPRWGDRARNLAATILAVAVMLYVAARLIEAVLPVLVGVAAPAAGP